MYKELKMKKLSRKSGEMKELLISAFLDLMKEKEYADITVSDIVKCAGVSRMAYYRSFSSKEAILVEYLKILVEEIEEKIRKNACCKKVSIYRLVLHMIAEQRSFFANIASANLTDLIVGNVVKYSYAMVKKYYHGQMTDDKRTEYAFYYHVGGLINTIRVWIDGGMCETVDEMSEMIGLFSEGGRTSALSAG